MASDICIFNVDERVYMSSSSGDEKQRDNKEKVLGLAEEKLNVSRETVIDRKITVKRMTAENQEVVDLTLNHHKVDITHVPVNQSVGKVPDIREENGVIIVPIVEEEVEVIRRLILREEVHIRRTEEQEHHEQSVSLRKQYVEIHKDDEES